MNPYQRKIFGILPLWAVIIGLGVSIMLAAAALSFYLKENLRERILKANAPTETTRFQSESERSEIQIKLAQDQLNSEKRLAEMDDVLPQTAEEKNRRRQLRAEKIEKWENEINTLKSKKEEADKKAAEPKRGDWSENYNTEGLFGASFIGVFALGCVYLAVVMRISSKPGELLTDLDKRALMFLLASVFGAIFVFLIFSWYLSISS